MICDHNIEQAGRNRRSVGGLVLWSVGLGLGIALVKGGAPLALRSVVFVPFMVGSLMLLQAMYRTCVVHALRHERSGALGVERVANPEQLRADAARVRRVFMASTLVASLATLLLLIVP